MNITDIHNACIINDRITNISEEIRKYLNNFECFNYLATSFKWYENSNNDNHWIEIAIASFYTDETKIYRLSFSDLLNDNFYSCQYDEIIPTAPKNDHPLLLQIKTSENA